MALRILVADDHTIVRRGVRALLESHQGRRVCGEAATGREAIRQVGLKPDLLVLDISMPDLNGLDVAHQVRDAAPQTKVVILSMYESEHMVRDALHAGTKAYVSKSDLDRDLLVAVRPARPGQDVFQFDFYYSSNLISHQVITPDRYTYFSQLHQR
jgi:DNA-binding NarL/FixJ family response regulator